MCALLSRAAIAISVFVIVVPLPTWAADVEEVELTIHPQAISEPAMQHRLLPSYLDQRSGNAAPMYLKALMILAEHNVDAKIWDDATRLAETPVDKMPREEARDLLKPFETILARIASATLRENCIWELGIRESEQPFAIQLPEVMWARQISRLLALKARLQIAEGRVDDAIGTLRTGLAFASHIAAQPTLISGLVGIEITHQMTAQLESLLQSPGAPNLYWSLTALPRPIADLRNGLRFEEVSLFMLFPRLMELNSTQYTPDQWDRFAAQVYGKVRGMHGLVGEPKEAAWLKSIDAKQVVASEYARAKRELQRRGLPSEQVEAMPQGKVVLLDFSLTYQELRDSIFKWFYVPIWQVTEGYTKAEAKLELEESEGIGRRFIGLLVPTIRGAHDAKARAAQQVALLRMIEALRNHVAKHGSLPSETADITDVPVPVDPFTGQLYELRSEDGSVVLDTLQRRGELIKRYRVKVAKEGSSQ